MFYEQHTSLRNSKVLKIIAWGVEEGELLVSWGYDEDKSNAT